MYGHPANSPADAEGEGALTGVLLLHFYPKLDIVSCRSVARKRPR
jgi:hypothetical protein